jgi:hypothetical protein
LVGETNPQEISGTTEVFRRTQSPDKTSAHAAHSGGSGDAGAASPGDAAGCGDGSVDAANAAAGANTALGGDAANDDGSMGAADGSVVLEAPGAGEPTV